jgi:hypothetical protein
MYRTELFFQNQAVLPQASAIFSVSRFYLQLFPGLRVYRIKKAHKQIIYRWNRSGFKIFSRPRSAGSSTNKEAEMKKIAWCMPIAALFSVLLCIFFVGCNSGDESGATSNDSGELAISLTDAVGDFGAYTVDVLDLTLTKANGAQVSTLPLSARIDFAQYTEMTEFLTAATVPAGVYVAATMTLDYTNADIWVEDENGDNLQVETILDQDGNPVSTLTVTVQLEDRNRLVIAPGIPAHLLLDFDLKATNQVAFDQGAPVLTVDPFLVADVNRMPNRWHRIRGLLDAVDTSQSSFSLFLRPFFCALSGHGHPYGSRTVMTDEQTLFEINGASYEGSDGLQAMAALDPLTAVVALGELRFDPLRFEASQVYAGSSVPGGELDVVKGNVIDRQGDTLTVKGATLIRNDSAIVFNDQVTVLLGDDTVVKRQLSVDPFDKDDISVGQRVVIFGTLTDDNPLSLEMDATEGAAHMRLTTLRGTAVAVDEQDATAQLTMNVQRIDHRRIEIFDFSGTGTDSANDVDPESYQIDTGTLDLTPLQTGAPVKVRGFVEPFGQAPPDFAAQTIVTVDEVRTLMKVDWRPPTGEAFSTLASEQLVLNLDGVGHFHHLVRGWIVTDLTELSQAPSVIPEPDARGMFVIRLQGTTQVYLEFEPFVEALIQWIDDGLLVNKLEAVGVFDDATAALTVGVVEIKLSPGQM